ncbi:hypothetical protein BT69DRAFT_1264915 [Atractiella rhizophila]|nr:hypothetical protein BT69DRAFT_1264915 [Atractiella rhizophila]
MSPAAALKTVVLFTLEETFIVVTTATAVAILHLRCPHSVFFGAGSLVAMFSAKFLKLFIRQSRPVIESTGVTTKKTYGMPSTHSSSVAFFATYITLTCLYFHLHPRLVRLIPIESLTRLRLLKFSPDAPIAASEINRTLIGVDVLSRTCIAVFTAGAGAAICWSRIYLGHHTPPQVVAGASLGSVIGVLWFVLWNTYAIKYDTPLQRLGENVVLFVWNTLTQHGVRQGSRRLWMELKSWDWNWQRLIHGDALEHREL